MLNKLVFLLGRYSRVRRFLADTEMYLFWSLDGPPKVLVIIEQLNQIEETFNIEISEYEACTLYDMSLGELSSNFIF